MMEPHFLQHFAVSVLVQCLPINGRDIMLVVYYGYGLPLTIKPSFLHLCLFDISIHV